MIRSTAPGGAAPAVAVEACVDTVASALAAEAAGAARVELCAGLAEGGTTPSAGMIERACRRLSIPVFAIIRPRGGDFCYDEDEIEVMRRDIGQARALGAGGIVLGVLQPDGRVDAARTRLLVEAARPLEVTFHRAFDVTPDAGAALETLVALGVDRVLTSGQAPTALEGCRRIAALVQQAAGRIGLLPGGGISEHNVRQVVAATGAREVHVRAATATPGPMRHHNPALDFGGHPVPSDRVRVATDAAHMARIVRLAAGEA